MKIVALKVVSLVVCLCMLGCQKESEAADRAGGARPPAPVVTQQVIDRALVVERRYLGEAVARSDAALSAAESARVLQVEVVEGDRVKKGELLVVFDDRLARAEFGEAVATRDQAEIEREHAKREAQRFATLEREAVVSELEAKRESDTAERLAARAQGVDATVKVRGERLRRHRIIAPFDGVVAKRLVDPGDWLLAGQPAVQLLSAGHVEVLVRVPEQLLDQLPQLERVELVSGERRAPASLGGAVHALDPATRTGLLRIVPEAPPAWLRAGASVNVAFFVEQAGGWVVPRDALVYGVGGVRVIRVVEGKAEPVRVEELAAAGAQALVSGELQGGDAIVIRGNERLRPGQAVTPEGALGAERAQDKAKP